MVLYTTSQYDKHYVVAHEISLTKNDKQFCIFFLTVWVYFMFNE